MNVPETCDALQKWLLTTGCDFEDQHSFVDAYCRQIRRLGVPVDRHWMSAVVLHPLVAARAWKWESTGKITDFQWSREEYLQFERDLATLAWSRTKDSPMYQLMVGNDCVRIRTGHDEIPEDCQWMLAENYTELYALPAPGNKQASNSSSNAPSSSAWSLDCATHGKLQGGFTWSTKQDGGFTAEQLEVLDRTIFALSAVLRFHIMKFTSKFLLMTYLGEDAGSRVHSGEIERGEGLTIRSVIWFSDVRGFTSMSGELHRMELIDVINSVFEVTQKVIRKHKGQVLKYMGDGCMAIFTGSSTCFQRTSFSSDQERELDEDQGALVCTQARLAATELQTCLEALRKERHEKGLRGASVGVGLHYGDISYGNVGAPDRLDFTVLGPHVNLASRTESLCGKLGAKILATEAFVNLDDNVDAWLNRGDHKVKGVADPVSIYELQEMSSDSS